MKFRKLAKFNNKIQTIKLSEVAPCFCFLLNYLSFPLCLFVFILERNTKAFVRGIQICGHFV